MVKRLLTAFIKESKKMQSSSSILSINHRTKVGPHISKPKDKPLSQPDQLPLDGSMHFSIELLSLLFIFKCVKV